MRSDISVYIVSFSLPESLEDVLSAALEQVPNDVQVTVFCSGGTDHHAARRVNLAREYPTVAFAWPRQRQTIGQSRTWIMARAKSAYVMFLDDDCVPTKGWWDGIERSASMKPAMSFGPRIPIRKHTLGSAIRYSEGLRSRKLTEKNLEISTVSLGKALTCAGGNFLLCTSISSVTHKELEQCAFEDVELQLRFMREGKKVLFCPSMKVEHHDGIKLIDLFKRSLSSGKGWQFASDFTVPI